jgi:hypothetical protein
LVQDSSDDAEEQADKASIDDSDDDEMIAEMLGEISDDEEREELAEAVIRKHEARQQIRSGKRTFAQAKATIREIKRSRKRFFPRKANLAKFKGSRKPGFGPPKKHSSGQGPPCFRCGSTKHLIKDCPEPSPSATGGQARYASARCSAWAVRQIKMPSAKEQKGKERRDSGRDRKRSRSRDRGRSRDRRRSSLEEEERRLEQELNELREGQS